MSLFTLKIMWAVLNGLSLLLVAFLVGVAITQLYYDYDKNEWRF